MDIFFKQKHLRLFTSFFFRSDITTNSTDIKANHSKSLYCSLSQSSFHSSACSAVMRFFIGFQPIALTTHQHIAPRCPQGNKQKGLKVDPLPCLWKCSACTAHLPGVKLGVAGGEREREGELFRGEEKDSWTIRKTKRLVLSFCFCWWKQNLLRPSASLCGTLVKEMLEGPQCMWRCACGAYGALKKG